MDRNFTEYFLKTTKWERNTTLIKYAQSPSQYNFITTLDNQQKNSRQRTFFDGS